MAAAVAKEFAMLQSQDFSSPFLGFWLENRCDCGALRSLTFGTARTRSTDRNPPRRLLNVGRNWSSASPSRKSSFVSSAQRHSRANLGCVRRGTARGPLGGRENKKKSEPHYGNQKLPKSPIICMSKAPDPLCPKKVWRKITLKEA